MQANIYTHARFEREKVTQTRTRGRLPGSVIHLQKAAMALQAKSKSNDPEIEISRLRILIERHQTQLEQARLVIHDHEFMVSFWRGELANVLARTPQHSPHV